MSPHPRVLHIPGKNVAIGDHRFYMYLISALKLQRTKIETVADLKKAIRQTVFRPVFADGFYISPITQYFYNDFHVHSMRTDLFVSYACLDSAEDIRTILIENLGELANDFAKHNYEINCKVDPVLYTVYTKDREHIVAKMTGIETRVFFSSPEDNIAIPILQVFQEKTIVPDDSDDKEDGSIDYDSEEAARAPLDP